MTKVVLLEALKERTIEVTKDLILPVKFQKGDTEPDFKPPNVYRARLPDGTSTTKFAPYVLHTVINSAFKQGEGEEPEGLVNVRSIMCVYHPDEQEGGLALLNLMERIRISLQKDPIIGNQFELNRKNGIEDLVYLDDTAPYFLGEMLTTWAMPKVKQEVPIIW